MDLKDLKKKQPMTRHGWIKTKHSQWYKQTQNNEEASAIEAQAERRIPDTFILAQIRQLMCSDFVPVVW